MTGIFLYRQIQFIVDLSLLWVDSFEYLCYGRGHLFLRQTGIARLELLHKILRCHRLAH